MTTTPHHHPLDNVAFRDLDGIVLDQFGPPS
jgi:hypothetical protein